MAEIQFVRAFLGALDGRPLKLPPDYVEDAKNYPAKPPYILPRMPKPMSKSEHSKTTPGQEPSVSVSVKSLHRSPPLDVKLGTLPLATTSLLDVRQSLAAQTHVPLAKLKILFNKKPVPDSKVLKDLVAGGRDAAPKLELGLMVVGGAATVSAAAKAAEESKPKAVVSEAPAPTAPATAAPAPGSSAQNIPETEAFWTDLRNFLASRVKDDKQADELFSLFLRVWEDRMA